MLAADMAREIRPYLDAGTDDAAVGSAIHYMMVLNPLIEIYVLAEDGGIRAFFADSDEAIRLDRVDLAPIASFLSGRESFPIYGDDPRRPSMPSTFSVAPLPLETGESGYLYVILGSGLYDSARIAIEDTYFRAAFRESLLYTVPLVAVIGLIVFFILTARLKRLTRIVGAFGAGDFSTRARFTSRDEIGELAESFNRMAATIQQSVAAKEQAERERRDLVANISHDLRTPLAAIRGYTETILDKGESLSVVERERFLTTSLASIDALAGMVEDLFELSRLEAREERLHGEDFSVAELCQDTVMKLAPLAERYGVGLSLTAPTELFPVHGEIPMLERVLTNFIDNAFRYAPAGSTIEVSLVRSGDSVRVQVSDQGPGLSPEERGRVFDRFYTGDPSRTSGRSGLGLAIAKRIVELHGGTIGVTGDPGSGSTFYFELAIVQR